MPYLIKNVSNCVLLFGIAHNDNIDDGLAIPIGGYIVGDDLGVGKFLSDSIESNRLTQDLFNSQDAGDLEITLDGEPVTYSGYLESQK